VTIAGRDPARSPALRRRLGLLLPGADLPPAPTVEDALGWMQSAHGVALAGALAALGIATLGPRRVASLGAEEARAVELAVALALPDPLALVLYEPFAGVGPADVVRARQRLTERVEEGCCVVLATSAPADLDDLVEVGRGWVHPLGQGRLLAGSAGLRWPPPQRGELTVWIEADAAELSAYVAALGREPGVVGVAWRAEPEQPASVTVKAEDAIAAAHAIAAATRQGQVRVIAVDRQPPDRIGLQEAAASQSRQKARATAPAASPLAQGGVGATAAAPPVFPGYDGTAGPEVEPTADDRREP
jgi:hypothetical protein